MTTSQLIRVLISSSNVFEVRGFGREITELAEAVKATKREINSAIAVHINFFMIVYGHHTMKPHLEVTINEQDAQFCSGGKTADVPSVYNEDFPPRKTSRLPFLLSYGVRFHGVMSIVK